MRMVTIALLALLALVHAELWLGKGGVPRVMDLEARFEKQKAENEAAHARNDQISAEVRDLKEGLEMVEEKARYELGMVKPDEIYVQVSTTKRQPVGMDALLQALQPFFIAAFTLWGSPVTWLEIVAFVLAIAMVVCNIRVNPIAWPLAIVSSLMYFALFWNSRLYGDASLQIVFVVVAGWGWWQWLRGTQADGSALKVRRLSTQGRWLMLGLLAISWPGIGYFLKTQTDTDVPWWDAFPTAGSLIGQWLLGRKYVENWAAWIVVNAVGVALFAYKGLWLTVVLYLVFIAMSFVGLRAWQRLAAHA